ncbi:hypothetical protein B0A48_04799 [Cryoendolithus antarcticus]|uniref:Uncharacterized protein n=1 Tax=Cryoendolithus antarcticus TaxID=1507870 RepID=A0A1V8TDR6_9PEZI|nr:hypothetical protein B0A48_04799 [Cryoendolithus antarcticus]
MTNPRVGTPKVTYGKKRPALLPLTAEQFRRSSIFEIPTGDTQVRRQSVNVDQCAEHQFTAEDSQLSDAESSEEVSSTPVNEVAESATASSLKLKSRSARRKSLRTASVSDVRPTEAPGKPSAASHHLKATSRRPSQRRATAGRRRQHMPLPNELLLLPMQLIEDLDTSAQAKTHRGSLPSLRIDPILSKDRRTDDQFEASEANDAPARSVVHRGLTAHRKRLKTTARQHKTIRNLQGKLNVGGHESPHDMPGDGFETSELKVTHRHRLKLRHRRKRRTEPLWRGFQELTLCAETADEPEFLRAPIKNEPIPGQSGALALSADRPEGETESYESSHMVSRDSEENKLPTVGPSGKSRQQELVAIELSSLSAPVRQYSVSVCSDEEADEDGIDDGAAESYVDHADIADDSIEEVVDVQSKAGVKNGTASEYAEDKLAKQRLGAAAFIPGCQSSDLHERPGLMRRPSGRYLVEVHETIFDDQDLDPDQDILLDDAPDPISIAADRRAPQPRSILKPSSTVTQVPIEAGPELTARNTRRNSRMTAVHSTHFSSSNASSDPDTEPMLDEESHYFTSAQQQLVASPAQPRSIIRTKSNNPGVGYTFDDAMDVQVPYSGSLTVAETSPVRERFSDESQLRILKRGGAVIWHTERDVRDVEQSLGRLTRRISIEHGTLSQGLRRRRSMASTDQAT